MREAAPDKILRVDANAAWTPKHALRHDRRAGRIRRGVRRAAAAAARSSTGCASCANARRCRSSPTNRASSRRDIPQLVGRRRWDQHQAVEVRRPARSAADDRDRARARHAGDGRLHDRDEPRHHRRGALRAAARLRRFRRRRAARGRSVSRRDDRRRRDSAFPPGRGWASRRHDRLLGSSRSRCRCRCSRRSRTRSADGPLPAAGSRVLVPVRSRRAIGIVLGPADGSRRRAPRAIIEAPDAEPVLVPRCSRSATGWRSTTSCRSAS